ncbi:hypothetical protein ACP4OV_009067 [Aristida adscensionis]
MMMTNNDDELNSLLVPADTQDAFQNGSNVVGVVIRDFTDDGLTALKWAHEHLKSPVNSKEEGSCDYKMWIIRIKLVKKNQTDKSDKVVDPKEEGEREWIHIEKLIKDEYPKDSNRVELLKKFQRLAGNFKTKDFRFRTFQGGNFMDTLQFAVNKFSGHFHMLILGNAATDGRWPAMPKITLVPTCSLVLVHNPVRRIGLTFYNKEEGNKGPDDKHKDDKTKGKEEGTKDKDKAKPSKLSVRS